MSIIVFYPDRTFKIKYIKTSLDETIKENMEGELFYLGEYTDRIRGKGFDFIISIDIDTMRKMDINIVATQILEGSCGMLRYVVGNMIVVKYTSNYEEMNSHDIENFFKMFRKYII
jgi:hypothetical protein